MGQYHKSAHEYYKNCGYVCRFFASDILNCYEVNEGSFPYLGFVEGWLDASSEFINIEDIEKTFSFKFYHFEHLNSYTASICDDNELESNVFNKLREKYLTGNNMPISSLIDLCVNGILYEQRVDALQQSILSRQNEILTSNEFKYDTERILYYIKSYFCLFKQGIYDNDIPELYTQILKKNRVTPEQRGYAAAISQLSLTKNICEDFFDGNKSCESQIRIIYDIVYFLKKYGSGPSHDCNANVIRKFLLKVLFFVHVNESKSDNSKMIAICEGIVDMFLWENAIYVNELSEFFYIANAKEMFLTIVDHWCGTNGILWNCSYDTVEYHGMNIVQLLNKFSLTQEAERIEKIILFRLFGYVDHKDYSLSGLLDCYNEMPLSEEKLLVHGMKFLAVSDIASDIGDNRIAGEIENVLFETAANLGIEYIAALFELKNNPTDFYNWRNCFLDIYFKKISKEEFSDDELVALYNIVNAWINEDIEVTVRFGNNQLEHLQHYNYKIIEKIKDKELRNTLISFGKNSPQVISNIDDYVVKLEDTNELLMDEIRKKGYSQEVEEKIIATFSNHDYRQSKLLIDIGGIVNIRSNPSFISNCVIEYIVRKRMYGYRWTGLKELIDSFYQFFNENDWTKLFNNIIDSISTTNIENFYGVNEDIETLCLYYFKGRMPEKMPELCANKLNTHWCWLTSCGLIDEKIYSLEIDSNIDSLKAFSEFQLGKRYK